MAKLSDKQYLELCKLSYLHEGAFTYVMSIRGHESPTLAEFINVLLADRVEENKTFEKMKQLVDPDKGTIENGGLFDKDFRDTLMFIKNDPILSELEFIENRNNNSSTGFVGMVFKDKDDNRYFTFTGTESRNGSLTLSERDWFDNIILYGLLGMSPQLKDAEKFASQHKTLNGTNYVTGHSRGGGNAAYVAAKLKDYNFKGVTFNAMGMKRSGVLTQEEEVYLFENITGYATYNDIVGNIFQYAENTVIADAHADFPMGDPNPDKDMLSERETFEKFFGGHYLQAFKFNDKDNVITYPERSKLTIEIAKIVDALPPMPSDMLGWAILLSFAFCRPISAGLAATPSIKSFLEQVSSSASSLFDWKKIAESGNLNSNTLKKGTFDLDAILEEMTSQAFELNKRPALSKSLGSGPKTHLSQLAEDKIRAAEQNRNNPLYNSEENTIAGSNNNELFIGTEYLEGLYGGYGDDRYIFYENFGNSVIYDIGGESDIVSFMISPYSDFSVQRDKDDLILTNKKTNDKLTIKGYFTKRSSIETIEFSNGFIITRENINLIVNNGSLGSGPKTHLSQLAEDKIRAAEQNRNNPLYNGEENTIAGSNNNELFIGTEYLEGLYGGYGDDRYIFYENFGNSVIYDIGGESDIVSFMISPYSDFSVQRDKDDLILTNKKTNDKLTIKGYFTKRSPIKTIEFSNGFIITRENINLIVNNGSLGSGPKTHLSQKAAKEKQDAEDKRATEEKQAAEQSRTFRYNDQEDTFAGGDGDDDLYGSPYIKELHGGKGNDRYTFYTDFGETLIHDTSGVDQIHFVLSNSGDFIFQRGGNDLIMTNKLTGDKLTIKDYFKTGSAIERIRFSNGIIITPRMMPIYLQKKYLTKINAASNMASINQRIVNMTSINQRISSAINAPSNYLTPDEINTMLEVASYPRNGTYYLTIENTSSATSASKDTGPYYGMSEDAFAQWMAKRIYQERRMSASGVYGKG